MVYRYSNHAVNISVVSLTASKDPNKPCVAAVTRPRDSIGCMKLYTLNWKASTIPHSFESPLEINDGQENNTYLPYLSHVNGM